MESLLQKSLIETSYHVKKENSMSFSGIKLQKSMFLTVSRLKVHFRLEHPFLLLSFCARVRRIAQQN